MAVIDFTNAVLDVNTDDAHPHLPMTMADYLYFMNSSTNLYDSSNQTVATSFSKSIISNTPTKVSVLFTGVFYRSGTSFYIGYYYGNNLVWKVSNISFSENDAFAFVIDIEVSGNS